jgi:hypothetical protein
MAWAIDDPRGSCGSVFSSQVFRVSMSGLDFCCRTARRMSASSPRISASIWQSSAIRLRASLAIGAGGDLGDLEPLPSPMRPTLCQGDRAADPLGIGEFAVGGPRVRAARGPRTGAGIGLQHAGIIPESAIACSPPRPGA